MASSELDKMIAELRFMDIILPDVYERVIIEDHRVKALNLDSINFSLFDHFPISIMNMKSLQRLSLRYNHLQEIPAEIFQISSLRYLDLSHNHVDEVPGDIARLDNLRELRLKANDLQVVPVLPPHLDRLHLGRNTLQKLPILPQGIQSVNLACNELSGIDQELPSGLDYLGLRSNLFSTIPEEATKARVSKINLYNNPIQWDEVGSPEYPGLILTDHLNPSRCSPYRILSTQFRDLRFSREHPPQFGVSYYGIPFTSVMIYGDDDVGKKSLIETYLHNYFIPDSNLFVSQNRYLNWDHYLFLNDQVFYQIWYPYSQQSYDPTYRTSVLNGFYYTNAVILVFDLSLRESFKTVLKSILQIYDIRTQSCSIIVVGNKSDLRSATSHSRSQIRNYLDNLERKTGLTIPYLEISVKDGVQVQRVFTTLFSIVES